MWHVTFKANFFTQLVWLASHPLDLFFQNDVEIFENHKFQPFSTKVVRGLKTTGAGKHSLI